MDKYWINKALGAGHPLLNKVYSDSAKPSAGGSAGCMWMIKKWLKV
jgi:hypothetical protein